MFDYAVCQIAGKQVIVEPGKEITVPFLGEVTSFECDKVVLTSEKGKINLGAPFLKDKIKFEVLGGNNRKIRVAFYKPKANHRKVVGSNQPYSRIQLAKVS
ncbi:MAG TPA: 50S ribosomal protein L21 [Patescibacteria group bacterium]|nr:50S ribosomal protein L21 [Patescibacteria group bacterium]